MCFHASNTKKAIQLENRFNARFEDTSEYTPYFHLNGFEYGTVYIIKQDEPDIIDPATWGLLPTHTDDVKGFRKKFNTLNARSESAMNSTLYSEPLQQRRCLILADGFFESKHVNGNTYPHFIRYKNFEPFAFAGLYNEHGAGVFSCSILTTKANPFMADIHNIKKRMPLILDQSFESKWLDENIFEEEILNLISNSFTTAEFDAYTVSKDVTNSRVISNREGILGGVYYDELNTLI